MSFLLHLHTALETAWVGISQAGKIIWQDQHHEPQGHAGFVQSSWAKGLQATGLEWSALAAVSVGGGPGSYTGIRVGMASAKGLCYARQVPLVQLSTLAILARAGALVHPTGIDFYLPLVDARRQEVFTALYGPDGAEARPAQSLLLDQENWLTEYKDKKILAMGSGLKKWDPRAVSPLWAAVETLDLGQAQVDLAEKAWEEKNFASLHLAEPLYAKAFYQPGKA